MTKDELRQQMPTVAAIVDEFRGWLANGGKLIYAFENGHVIDRREPEEHVYELEPLRFQIARPAKKEKR
jgi:hypothetical protein